MGTEDRNREELRLNRISPPLRLIRAPDVRARAQYFGGIRNIEQKRARESLDVDDKNLNSIESLPFFQRKLLNEVATVLPAVRRQANFLTTNFSVGATPLLLREREKRLYFLIQNNSSINSIFLGFDYTPTALNGVVLVPGAVYEPYEVPTNDIWISASGAATVGLIVYATEK